MKYLTLFCANYLTFIPLKTSARCKAERTRVSNGRRRREKQKSDPSLFHSRHFDLSPEGKWR